MAFWGIEVKPGKPITHSFDRGRRKLRIKQATLGIGSVMAKTLVQCNVGDRRPVFLCGLLPDKMEFCNLDLEFEEAHDVVFSVIGPCSVHLTGYYVSESRHYKPGSDSETYGEDIANTETDESVHNTNDEDEDKYEDSFIDDDDEVEVFSDSLVSNDQDDKIMSVKKTTREQKGNSKLQRKRMQVIDSDPESTSDESEDVDNFFLSEFKSKNTANRNVSEVEEKNSKGTMETAVDEVDCDTSNGVSKEILDGLMMHTEAERENIPTDSVKEEERKPKERSKTLASDGEAVENNTVNHVDGLINTKSEEENIKVDNCENLIAASNEDQSEPSPAKKKKLKRKRKEQSEKMKPSGKVEDEKLQIEADMIHGKDKDIQKPIVIDGNFISSVTMARNEESSKNDQNPKKKRKSSSRERSVQIDNGICNSNRSSDHPDQPVLEARNMDKDLCPAAEKYKKPTTDAASDPVVQECKVEKAKKKKKKSKARETASISVLSEIENKKSPVKLEEENNENRKSKGRELSNGLTIEELAPGAKNGKIATLGRKVKVFYTGKLTSSGHVFDSNIGKAPYKFLLGDESVIEGWNVGLQGMRDGERRRLIIPPSMGFGCEGAGENIPPNSWLEYEVELLKAF